MRRSMLIILAAVVMPVAASAATAPAAEACKAGVAALLYPLPLRDLSLYSPDPPGQNARFGYAGPELADRWEGQAPETELLARLPEAVERTGMECAEVRAAAAKDGEVMTQAEALARLKAAGFNGKTFMWRRLSLPILSKDGRSALVLAIASSNQLAGGMELLHLARDAGGWQVVGRRVVIVS